MYIFLTTDCRFDLALDTRLEYLRLAVANAKSHPISTGGRHESAIVFLTDLEEKLEVAQVQLEIYNTLLAHANDAPEVGERINRMSRQTRRSLAVLVARESRRTVCLVDSCSI